MKILAVCYVTRGVVRSQGAPETIVIVIVIVTSVIAPVVPAEVGSADDVRSSDLLDVPLVESVVVGVCRVVEVVVVDQVAARRGQADAIVV